MEAYVPRPRALRRLCRNGAGPLRRPKGNPRGLHVMHTSTLCLGGDSLHAQSSRMMAKPTRISKTSYQSTVACTNNTVNTIAGNARQGAYTHGDKHMLNSTT